MLKVFCCLVALLSFSLLFATGLPQHVNFSKNGSLQVDDCRFSIQCFFPKWKASENKNWKESKSKLDDTGLTLTGTMMVDGKSATVIETITPTDDQGFQLKFNAKFNETTSINALHGVFSIPISTASITVDGVQVPLPDTYKELTVYRNGKAQKLSFVTAGGTEIEVSGSPLKIVVQDGRGIGSGRPNSDPKWSIRLGATPSGGNISEANLALNFNVFPFETKRVELSEVVNAGFADEIAGDGKGGWSDQGPERDLRMIQPGVIKSGAVDYEIIDVEKNHGRGVLVLCGSKQSFTGSSASVALPENQFRVVNLLHTSAWPASGQLGTITASYSDGTSEVISVHGRKDCGNWTGPVEGSNAVIGWRAENLESTVGLYSSSFLLKKSGAVSLRFEVLSPNSMWMIAGVTLSNRRCAPVSVADSPVELKEDANWKRLYYQREVHAGSALDFSFLVDGPAGKYGFIEVASDGSLVFEKAQEKHIRLYGANLVFTASFLNQETVDKLVEYFAYCGYNSMRIHHQDKLLINPQASDSVTLDEKQLDMLDYLFYKLKERGLYVTTDFYTTRKFKQGDGIGDYGALSEGMKVLLPLNSKAMDNWKEFTKRWMTHRNPYTKLTWAEDPALWCVDLVNEEPLHRHWGRTPASVKLYSEAFQKYCTEKQLPYSDPSNSNPAFRRFLHELQAKTHDEQIRFVKNELKMKALVTSVNFTYDVPLTLLRSRLDIVDNHQYSGCREATEIRGRLPYSYGQHSLIGGMASLPRAMMPTRVPGRPFMVTEFNYGDKNIYRAEGGPLVGAFGSLQGWNALYRFAWSHSSKSIYELVASSGFNAVCDPMMQLSDRIASVMFIRGDVETAKTLYAYTVPADCFEQKMLGGFPTSFSNLGLITAIGSAPQGDSKLPANVINLSPDDASDLNKIKDAKVAKLWKQANEKKIAESITGQLRLDANAKSFTVTSSRTESITLNGGTLSAGFMKVCNASTFQTVATISLDGKPLVESDSLLVLQLTNIATTGDVFANEKKQLLLAIGTLPLLVQKGSAEIELASGKPYQVSALNSDGVVLGEVTGTLDKTGFKFKADTTLFEGGVVGYHLTR